MNVKETIYRLLSDFYAGKCDARVFCDQFCELYYYEESGYRFFSDKERATLDDLASVVERYSTSSEDLKKFPNTQFQDIAVLFNVSEVCDNLNKNGVL